MYDYMTVIVINGKDPSGSILKELRRLGKVTVTQEIIATSPGPRPVHPQETFYKHSYKDYGPFDAGYFLTRIAEGVTLFHVVPAVDDSDLYIRFVGNFVYCFEQKNEEEGMFFVMKRRSFLNHFKDKEVYVRSQITRMTNPGYAKRIRFIARPIRITFAKAAELMNWDGTVPDYKSRNGKGG